MSVGTCTRCGRPLEEGACPLGHPQRRAKRRRRRGRFLVIPVILGLIGGGIYAGLVWYPPYAAADVMGPASTDFAKAVRKMRATIEIFPNESGERPFLALANSASRTRGNLDVARARLDGRTLPGYPIVSARPQIRQANTIRDAMLEFYADSLELLSDLQAVSSYVSAVAPLLPNLSEIEGTLGNAVKRDKVRATVGTAVPIATSLRAGVRAVDPPRELGELHARLRAMVIGIANDLEEVGGLVATRRPDNLVVAGPVIATLYRDVKAKAASFRQEIAQIPTAALDGGLDERLDEFETSVRAINEALADLRDRLGVDGLTVERRN